MESLELQNNLKGSDSFLQKDRHSITDSGFNNRRLTRMNNIFETEQSSQKTDVNSTQTEVHPQSRQSSVNEHNTQEKEYDPFSPSNFSKRNKKIKKQKSALKNSFFPLTPLSFKNELFSQFFIDVTGFTKKPVRILRNPFQQQKHQNVKIIHLDAYSQLSLFNNFLL